MTTSTVARALEPADLTNEVASLEAFHRFAADRRLPGWLRSALGEPALTVDCTSRPTAGVELALAFDGGELSLRVDPAPWPALDLVVGLSAEQPQLGRDALEALLAGGLHRLGRRLPGLRITGIEPAATPADGPALRLSAPRWQVVLLPPSLAVLGWLARALQVTDPSLLGPWQGLRVAARVVLFERTLPLADLKSLRPGDAVLRVGTGALTLHVRFGRGTVLQALAHLEPSAGESLLAPATAVLDTEPRPVTEPSNDALGLLGLPVSFEIDSARIALVDLAALGPGAILGLAAPVRDATVRLVVQGQVVGHGRLIALGERLGVRVEHMGIDVAGLLSGQAG